MLHILLTLAVVGLAKSESLEVPGMAQQQTYLLVQGDGQPVGYIQHMHADSEHMLPRRLRMGLGAGPRSLWDVLDGLDDTAWFPDRLFARMRLARLAMLQQLAQDRFLLQPEQLEAGAPLRLQGQHAGGPGGDQVGYPDFKESAMPGLDPNPSRAAVAKTSSSPSAGLLVFMLLCAASAAIWWANVAGFLAGARCGRGARGKTHHRACSKIEFEGRSHVCNHPSCSWAVKGETEGGGPAQ